MGENRFLFRMDWVMKMYFRKEPSEENFLGEGEATVTHVITTVKVEDAVKHFEDFLRGCGFMFDGHLDFVEDEK
jgi:hypothetical protein